VSVTWNVTLCYWVSVTCNVIVLPAVSYVDCDTVKLAVSLGVSKAVQSLTHHELHTQGQHNIPEDLSV